MDGVRIEISLTLSLAVVKMMNSFLCSLGKSFLWSILTLFFGLFPVWIILLMRLALTGEQTPCNALFMDGALLFFSTAIVWSLTIDYHISEKHFNSTTNKSITDLLFIIFPTTIFVICLWLFTVCYGRTPTEIHPHFISSVEQTVFGMTIMYAFGKKAFDFYKRECQ